MYRPYTKPVSRAKADVKLLEPRVQIFVIFLLKVFARLYIFLFFGVARILLKGDKHIFDSFKRALEGKSRCIVAFRHPNGGEPQLLTWFFLFKLGILARRKGVKFPRQPHAVFVYGYEVVRWGGWVARYIMPRVGAMPIHHTKVDRHGMTRIYNAIIDGPYPLALAPEGQVSYTAESLPRLEQGTIRMGFHAAEKTQAKHDIPVEVLPLSIHFRFGSWGKLALEGLLRRIERFTNTGSGREIRKLPFNKRLERCRNHILEVNEKRYDIKGDTSLPFEKRLNIVINTALETGERIMGLKPEADFFTRLYNLRQVCWDKIILPGVDSLNGMSPLEWGTANLLAGQAWHASRHMELADLGWYFCVALPKEDAPLHATVEYAQNLWDFANRTLGGAYSNRRNILPRRVIIQSAPPINLTERLPDYHKDKKAAIQMALTDLQNAYLDCIEKVNQPE